MNIRTSKIKRLTQRETTACAKYRKKLFTLRKIDYFSRENFMREIIFQLIPKNKRDCDCEK